MKESRLGPRALALAMPKPHESLRERTAEESPSAPWAPESGVKPQLSPAGLGVSMALWGLSVGWPIQAVLWLEWANNRPS